MEIIEKIINIIVWPATAIVIVLLLRTPLSELILTLKKLKYRDLELDFEREANKILAEAERDLPELPEPQKANKAQESDLLLPNVSRIEPAMQIMESWRDLELKIRNMLGGGSEYGSSIRTLINKLQSSEKISQETVNLLLDLAALRNRVAHAKVDAISYEVASAYSNSAKRVMAALDVGKA